MFTGIIQKKATVTTVEKRNHCWALVLTLPKEYLQNFKLGSSLAVNGVCLSLTHLEGDRAGFDVMMETLKVTNLQYLQVGDLVNVERAACFGDEIGGHLMSGHVMAMIKVVRIDCPENNRVVWFRCPSTCSKYLFRKGYVGLNGASLTLAEVVEDEFCVYFIPETLRRTTFSDLSVGAWVNLEIDNQTQVVVEVMERLAFEGKLAIRS